MNCTNKELFQSHHIRISSCRPTRFSVQPQRRGPRETCCPHQHFLASSAPQSLFLPFLSFPLFSLTLTLKVFLCLSRHMELSVSLSPPSLPLFSLASPVSLPRDSRLLCSRYRPIDFGRERKYCGHDSPCMNLMIPVYLHLLFQWRSRQIKHSPFLSASLQACQ